MGSLLVAHASVLVTMDDGRREIPDGGLYAVDGFIREVGATAELPDAADEVLDLTGHVVLPGLVNTHHHFYQTLTRALPGAQDVGLFDWLRVLYPVWARLTPEDVFVATQVALAELAMSGCTTAVDHQYLFPNGSRVDHQVAAAETIGLRLQVSRGSMSLGESSGGLPPDSVVEDEDHILADTERRVIDRFHQPAAGAMVQVVVAPCSPFSVTPALMRASAELAREKGVTMHTHVAETADEEDFCVATHGMRPVALMESLGWAGPDVSYAHAVFVDPAEIATMARYGTGVAHCPSSNMRLASGIAPVAGYLGAGVPVGIGVDGSASNDGSHLLGEARQALLLARLAAAPPLGGGDLLPVRTALEMATRGGARVVGRNDIGALERDRCADFTAISLDRIGYAGAGHDPVAATLLAAPVAVDHTYVGGRPVVSGGELVGVEAGRLVERHNTASARLVGG